MRLILSVVAVCLTGSAFAQSQPPSYTPWQVDEQDAQILGNALGEIPAKWANPIINFLAHKEDVAQAVARQKEAEMQKDAAAKAHVAAPVSQAPGSAPSTLANGKPMPHFTPPAQPTPTP